MSRVRRPIPRSRIPLHRLLRSNPEVLRRWMAVLLLGGATALLVGRSLAAAESARAGWGTTTAVLVADGPVDAGSALAPRVRLEQWPLALAPPEALSEVAPDARASGDIEDGMPVTRSAVMEPDSDGTERIEVSVPLGAGSMTFDEGDRVDLWSTVDPGFTAGASGGALTVRVAVRARVTAASEPSHVVVAVDADEAAAVVEALALATVTPVAVPRSSGG